METEREKGIDINQCLKLFTEEEQLREGEEWYCSNCKDHKRYNIRRERNFGKFWTALIGRVRHKTKDKSGRATHSSGPSL